MCPPKRSLAHSRIGTAAGFDAAPGPREPAKPADRALVDPASGGRGWSEIGIIRVGDDDREAVRTPGMRISRRRLPTWCGVLDRIAHQAITPTCAARY